MVKKATDIWKEIFIFQRELCEELQPASLRLTTPVGVIDIF